MKKELLSEGLLALVVGVDYLVKLCRDGAIDVRSRREGRDLRKVGFYDPIKNQTCLNVPAT
ncbi:hypothetical protein ZWY2020_038369 [Hordeum vulgare]|nr:hypothetical protein ZWY2020_038369 [Hordeum vulgare]